jgi:AcrR family transcriptional regulator
MKRVPPSIAARKAPRSAQGRRLTKPAYHHGDLRAALVDATARLASERGAAAVSLREVARRAGVSQAAPYHYFADKSALLAGVAEQGFRLFDTSQAEAVAQAGPDPSTRLAALGVSYVRFALDHPNYFKVMFRPHLVEHRKYPLLNEVASRSFERLVETVRAARAAHGHDDLEPVVAATLVWAVPHGLAMLYLDGPISGWMSPGGLEALAAAATAPLAAAPFEELGPRTAEWGI